MRRHLPLIAVLLVAFLGVSVLVARYLTTENRERDLVYELLRAQARGDAAGMLARLDGCARIAACRAEAEANARRLRRPGDVKILAYDSSTSYALWGASGLTRVAWTVPNRGLPVVQCVEVRRKGNAIAGRTITLTRLSAPIGNESSC